MLGKEEVMWEQDPKPILTRLTMGVYTYTCKCNSWKIILLLNN